MTDEDEIADTEVGKEIWSAYHERQAWLEQSELGRAFLAYERTKPDSVGIPSRQRCVESLGGPSTMRC